MLKILSRGALLFASLAAFPFAASAAQPWVTAFYTYWEENILPPAAIDMSGITHLVYFAVTANADGSLNTRQMDQVAAVVEGARSAGKKVLFSIGGAGNDAMGGAMKPANVDRFVANLVDWMAANGFDGVDVDFEGQYVEPDFQNFVVKLRQAMKSRRPDAVLTGDFGASPADVKPIFDDFDQINLMTYDMSGPWPGWITWHNGPLFSNGVVFPSTGGPVPSCEAYLRNWLTAGCPASKLGFGIDSWAQVWSPASGPRQDSAQMKTTSVMFSTLATTWYSPDVYHWDAGSQAAWLGVDGSFASFDDPKACAAKVRYLKSMALGGLIVWDINAQYVDGKNPLLDAIRAAMAGEPISDLPEAPSFSASLNASPLNAFAGAPVLVTVDAKNLGGTPASQATATVQVVDAAGQVVESLTALGQSFSPGKVNRYKLFWTPTKEGVYRVRVKIVNAPVSLDYRVDAAPFEISVRPPG